MSACLAKLNLVYILLRLELFHFFLVNGFGAASGVLQYVSRASNEQERLGYLKFAFRSGSAFNLLIGILIIIYALVTPLPIPTAKPILLSMALFPIGRLYIDIFRHIYVRSKIIGYKLDF